jgi:hypothetical protein
MMFFLVYLDCPNVGMPANSFARILWNRIVAIEQETFHFNTRFGLLAFFSLSWRNTMNDQEINIILTSVMKEIDDSASEWLVDLQNHVSLTGTMYKLQSRPDVIYRCGRLSQFLQ